MRTISLAALTIILALANTAQADRIKVKVQVVDANGKPVAGAVVAAIWMPKFPELKLPMLPEEPFHTDVNGFAEGQIEGSYPLALSAFDQAKRLGGYVQIGRDSKVAVIKLLPMQPVQFDYSFPEGKELRTPWMEAQLVLPTGERSSTARPAYVFPLSKDPIFLPPGSYRFIPGAENARAKEHWIEVPKMNGIFKVPKFDLTPTKVFTLAGKSAPELSVVGVMNISSKVNLADYRGKWVLIDFWGTWCSACKNGMPRLIDFYNRNKSKRSKFELLSLHDSSQPSVADTKASIAKIVKGQWKGKTLPFPVLLDQGGKTVAAYGIFAFPTEVLIDPEGRVVDGGNLEMLEKKLAKG